MSPIERLRRLEPLERTVVKLGLFGATLLVVIIALVVAVVALARASDARGFAQADCGTWHDLAIIPPSPNATESGLKLYAGFRDSYLRKGCTDIKGTLPPADPRLLPYLTGR